MIVRHDQTDRGSLARALSDAVAADLKAGIAERGQASLAVSGGSTPAAFFAELGRRGDIEWSRVTVTLVDERWVDDTSDRSNARLVKEHLLQGPAIKARFVPLHGGGVPSPDAIATVCKALEKVPHPFDAVILGMGGDGHTASFFPGGDALDKALTGKGPAIAIRAPGAGEPRVTLTLPHLLKTRSLYLHIEGSGKAETLQVAMQDGPTADMPVRAVLRQAERPVQVYWCP